MKLIQQNQLKNNLARNNEDDFDDIPSHSEFLGYFEQSQSRSVLKVFLDEDIRQPAYYRQLIQRLHTLDESDSCFIFIDTYGGSLDGALAICDAIENSAGSITAVVTGSAYSAGSMIALKAPNLIVGDNARFLCHSARYGFAGKAQDVRDHQEFTDKLIDKVFMEAYTGFLTDKEIQQCKEGKEFYMLSEEVQQRLVKRDAFLKKIDKEIEKLTKKSDQVKPKATKVPKVKNEAPKVISEE